MKSDPFAGMTPIDLSLPLYNDTPIWSAKPRRIVDNCFSPEAMLDFCNARSVNWSYAKHHGLGNAVRG